MRRLFRKIFPLVLISLSSGWASYYLFFQKPGVISLRRIGFAVITTIIIFILLEKFRLQLSQLVKEFAGKRKLPVFMIGGLLTGFILVLLIVYPGILVENLLVPSISVKISSTEKGSIEVSWLNNGFQDVSFSEFTVINGTSNPTNSGIMFTPTESGNLEILWNGRAINYLSVVAFSPDAVPFVVYLNNQIAAEAELSSGKSSLSVNLPVRHSLLAAIVPVIVIGIFSFIAISFSTLLLLQHDSLEKPRYKFNKEPKKKVLSIIVIFLSLSAIGLLVFIGLNNRYLYDDYCYAASGRNDGCLECITSRLQSTNGRFSQMSLLCLMDIIYPFGFRLSVGILQVLLFVSTYLAYRSIFSSSERYSIAISASLVYLLMLVSVPYIAHTVIWYSGMVTVVPSLIGFNLLVFLCFFNLKKVTISYWVITGILITSFINAGFNETIDSMIVGLSFLLVIATFVPEFSISKKLRYHFIVTLMGTLSGFILMASLPGTSARMARYVQTDIGFGMIATIFESGLETLRAAFGSLTGMTAFSLILVAGISTGTVVNLSGFSQEQKWKLSFGVFILAWLVYFGGFVPAAYALNANMPQRTMIVPLYLLIFFLFSSLVLIGNILRTPWKFGSWIILFLSIFYLTGLFYARYLPISKAFAQYAIGYDTREIAIMQAKTSGSTMIEVESIIDPEILFGDIKSSSDYWVNKCASKYFDIDVRLIP